jgi:hypothetical protein
LRSLASALGTFNCFPVFFLSGWLVCSLEPLVRILIRDQCVGKGCSHGGYVWELQAVQAAVSAFIGIKRKEGFCIWSERKGGTWNNSSSKDSTGVRMNVGRRVGSVTVRLLTLFGRLKSQSEYRLYSLWIFCFPHFHKIMSMIITRFNHDYFLPNTFQCIIYH